MQDAATVQAAETQVDTTPLPLRGDTFLGVCEALGQDTRVPADLFRIAFAALFFWNMLLAVGVYLGLGAVIALSRWLFPAAPKTVAIGAAEPVEQKEEQPLPLAA
jgi:phage shock protein PspC (stress-responsive transcriptional regulator)